MRGHLGMLFVSNTIDRACEDETVLEMSVYNKCVSENEALL